MESKPLSLFGEAFNEEAWKKEWVGMPEFVQEDKSAFKQVIVSFECEEDMNEFAKLLDQKITPKTLSLWFPRYNRERPSKFLYINKL